MNAMAFLEAIKMSNKYESSRLEDDLGAIENPFASNVILAIIYSILFDQINFFSENYLQLIFHGYKVK